MIEPTGAYTTARAAALAAVPRRTLNYWVTSGMVTPSVSSERVRLWSYEDLVRIRMVEWLRRDKEVAGVQIKGAALPTIRAAVDQLQQRRIAWWDVEVSPLRVSPAGHVLLLGDDQLLDVTGQVVIADAFDPVEPFEDVVHGLHGPHLLRPRDTLRIRPGKLSGAPHIDDTRVETQALYALASSGYRTSDIVKLYPFLSDDQINDAIDLEDQLARNLGQLAA
jgi:uncharacterized protein (DUF433 family)/DNA-binding transcriptional MerR regulator